MIHIPSKEEHEKDGDVTCPKCHKKFIADLTLCTYDVVGYPNRPDVLSVSEGYCPHCHHSFELGYTPMPGYVENF